MRLVDNDNSKMQVSIPFVMKIIPQPVLLIWILCYCSEHQMDYTRQWFPKSLMGNALRISDMTTMTQYLMHFRHDLQTCLILLIYFES